MNMYLARVQPVWLFDLDDTLHKASAHIFPHINRAMTAYVATALQLEEAEANRLRMDYWQRYGATLTGLMRHHGTDPHHFLENTHQFPDLKNMLVSERRLRATLRKLPGRKIVFSNGPRAYAHTVINLLGIRPLLDDIVCIEHTRFRPKPSPAAFHTVLRRLKVPASRCIMVEDSADNLRTAKMLGMRTVWISSRPSCPPHVDYKLRSVAALPRLLARL